MVRQLVLRYPLLLGTAMNRVAERLEAMQACHYRPCLNGEDPTTLGEEDTVRSMRSWCGDFLTILRRSNEAHEKWKRRQGYPFI